MRYSTLDQLVVAYTQDLSRGGMFLRTQKFLPLNAVVRLHLELPEGGGEINVVARVVYVRDEKDASSSNKSPGMGVQFLDLAGESSERIESFIAERTAMEAERSGAHRLARRISVLVVDDNDGYREAAAEPFRARGDTVRTAMDGLQGLAACLKEPPDVVLSDVQMPRMDGWQLLRVIRARPSLASIPVIFLTTLAGEEERLRGYQLGVDDYVAKPYRSDELVARVERVMARAHKGNHALVEKKTLRGDLEQVALPSVLTFLELERKTGVLFLVGAERTARLFLRDGRPMRAEIDSADGEKSRDLVWEVLAWPHGQFEFAAQDVACDDEIRMSVTSLLLELARRGDEANR